MSVWIRIIWYHLGDILFSGVFDQKPLPSLKQHRPVKIHGCKMILFFGMAYFQEKKVSFREWDLVFPRIQHGVASYPTNQTNHVKIMTYAYSRGSQHSSLIEQVLPKMNRQFSWCVNGLLEWLGRPQLFKRFLTTKVIQKWCDDSVCWDGRDLFFF